MQSKLALILLIIILITILLFIKSSSRRLWQSNPGNRIFTLRSVLLIGVILVFLFFSLFR